jgi:tetratricopeptide (TPR) repeat protein
MAMLGGVMLVAAGLCRIRQPSLRARPGTIGVITVGLAVLLGLVLLTRDQCRSWRTSEALWTHALNHGAGRSSIVHYYLGVALDGQGKTAEAAARYAEAVRLRPDYAEAHNNLGVLLARQGKTAEAAAHFAEAVRLKPDYADAHNNRAMILAACPVATYRDGTKAVEAATRACELTGWKIPGCLGTLAAAYAEAGDFDAAVAWQMRAIGALKDERAKDDYRSRLATYRAKRPYREASPGHSGHE